MALWLASAVARADPENFMVGDFTFVRPSSSVWVWDEKRANMGNLLDVPSTNSSNAAVVYFWKFKTDDGGLAGRKKVWQAFFKELPDDLHTRTTTKKINDLEIIYLEIEGTFYRAP